jgi:hypothetical protein
MRHPRNLCPVPTPVGPLGPEEIDPYDPDTWDWDAETPLPTGRPAWIRLTALVCAVILILFVIASFSR